VFAPDPASLPTPSTRPDLRTASLPACAPRTAPASAQQARHTPDRNEHRQERRLDTARTRASTDCPPHGGETQWQAPALRRFRATWMRRPQRRGAPPASMGTHRRLPGVTRACLEPGSTVSRDREALVRLVRTRGEGALQAGGLWGPFPARSAPSGWDRQTAKKRGLPGRGAAWRVGRDATPAQNGGSRLSPGCKRSPEFVELVRRGKSARQRVITMTPSTPAVCHGSPLPVSGPIVNRMGTSQTALKRGRITATGASNSAKECIHTIGTATIIAATASANERRSSPRQPSTAAPPDDACASHPTTPRPCGTPGRPRRTPGRRLRVAPCATAPNP